MAVKIQVRRGRRETIPSLAAGEFGLATNTSELFIGGEDGNMQVPVLGEDGKVKESQLPDNMATSGDVSAVQQSISSHAQNKSNPHGVTAAQAGAVPTSRTVNGKALSSNISLTAADVSAVPTARKVNNKALASDITLSASDVGAVPTSRTVNGKALSANISLSASDVSALPLSGGTLTGALYTAADSTVTTAKVRRTSLHTSDTNPSVNGAIAWTYQ